MFACTAAHVRRLPGRLVGETVDVEGRPAYVTTLRAREQDISSHGSQEAPVEPICCAEKEREHE
jgi:glycine cleavage system pyridoxal-binding protein P